MASAIRHFYEFGDFRLDADKRRLLRDGEVVPLPPKAVEALLVLVQNPGKPLEREDLMKAVWTDSFVEDANLTVAISNLRKALGQNGESAEYIETVPRVGYRFVAEVHEVLEKPKPLIVEKHTLSRTVVEEEIIDEPAEVRTDIIVQPAALTRSLRLPQRRGIVLSILIGLLLVGGVSSLIYFKDWRSGAAVANTGNIKSIAVLPLKSFGQNTDDRALSYGFADALMTSLGSVNGVRVLSATSINRDAEQVKRPAEIGRDMRVDAVLDGTLQRANGKLRVTLRLIRVSDDVQIWSGSFDEDESNVFKLQDAITAQTVQSFKWRLSEEKQRQIARRYTENSLAYQAYLRGRLFFDERNAEGYEKAIAEYQHAIELDPKYALAYSGLADVYALQATSHREKERNELYEKARTTAMKALELDEGLAEAHTSLGWIRRVHDWDWKGSEAEFRRAIELNPNYANARQWYSFLLATEGRLDESLREMQAANEIDPLSRRILVNLLAVRDFRREFDQARPLLDRIVSLQADDPDNLRLLSIEYLLEENYARVIEIGNEVRLTNGNKRTSNYLTANLAVAYARTGQTAKANELLAYLESRARNDSEVAFRLAMACSDIGRKDEAIRLLQQSFAAHDDRMVWIKIEPRFDPLRADYRFQDLIRKMNL